MGVKINEKVNETLEKGGEKLQSYGKKVDYIPVYLE